jgi:hypothetical protein
MQDRAKTVGKKTGEERQELKKIARQRAKTVGKRKRVPAPALMYNH